MRLSNTFKNKIRTGSRRTKRKTFPILLGWEFLRGRFWADLVTWTGPRVPYGIGRVGIGTGQFGGSVNGIELEVLTRQQFDGARLEQRLGDSRGSGVGGRRRQTLA